MNPYRSLPDTAFWKKSVADVAPTDVAPIDAVPFLVDPKDKIVTAGSCFAQHIARYLSNSGFDYHVAEKSHPLFPDPDRDATYGAYSARYGNIYTSKQLLQLFREAFGLWRPSETCWPMPDGTFIDPYRPAIEPKGFGSEAALHHDRHYHLSRVRAAFEEMDVFVFTLGLTECWVSKEDGAVFPLCPGTAGGVFDPDKYEFRNLSVSNVVNDLKEFTQRLEEVNPNVRIVLTVSTVPLVATASGDHVLCATTLSKSILRVAAADLARARDNIAYFPSYEIITGSYNRGRYFAPDLRGVTEDGVAHAMRIFMENFTTTKGAELPSYQPQDQHGITAEKMAKVVEVMCEEEMLETKA